MLSLTSAPLAAVVGVVSALGPVVAAAAAATAAASPAAIVQGIAPKVLIVTFFGAEGEMYLSHSNDPPDASPFDGEAALDFTALTHRVPMASPRYPDLHCTAEGDACVITTGEGMINAATTTMALLADPFLDLSETYWVLSGIAGGAPDVVSLNSVALARYTVQISMQHEIDSREMPPGFSTGYFPQGTTSPDNGGEDAPLTPYGSEVFELNAALRDLVTPMIDPARIVDTDEAKAYRELYAPNKGGKGQQQQQKQQQAPSVAGELRKKRRGNSVDYDYDYGYEEQEEEEDPNAGFGPGASPPTVTHCDVASSDTWWTGRALAASFASRIAGSWTEGNGVYCATAQEDGAVVGAVVRGSYHALSDTDSSSSSPDYDEDDGDDGDTSTSSMSGRRGRNAKAKAKANAKARADRDRIVVIRTISDFDRPHAGQSALENLVDGARRAGAFRSALENAYRAGHAVARGLLAGWDGDADGGVARGDVQEEDDGDVFRGFGSGVQRQEGGYVDERVVEKMAGKWEEWGEEIGVSRFGRRTGSGTWV